MGTTAITEPVQMLMEPLIMLPAQIVLGPIIGLIGIGFGATGLSRAGFTRWPMLWIAVSCVIVSLAYLGNCPGVFGKRADGRMAWWIALPVLPYLLFSWLYWRVELEVSRTASYNEIVSGIFVGRRVREHELPEEIDLVVDLTSEFSEPTAVRSGRAYRCFPTLDGAIPHDVSAFRQFVTEIAAYPGTVYIHCAAGKGRVVPVAAAVLMLRSLAGDVDEAIEQIRNVRPSIRPTWMHRRFVARVSAGFVSRDA